MAYDYTFSFPSIWALRADPIVQEWLPIALGVPVTVGPGRYRVTMRAAVEELAKHTNLLHWEMTT